MKPVQFLGGSLKRLREFPEDIRMDVGYQIDKVQHGQQPDDFKPMPSIGKVSKKSECGMTTGGYRVSYTARLAD